MPTTMSFQTDDVEFGLRVNRKLIEKCLIRVAKIMKPNETGGLLMGFYTLGKDWAIITDIFHMPGDSRRTYMRDGKKALEIIKRVENDSHYEIEYVGEWHTHPGGGKYPTDLDDSTMLKLAKDLDCTPLLMILGDNFTPDDISVHVYTDKDKIELRRVLT